MKMKHNWTKSETIFTVALVAILVFTGLLVGLTDTETSMAILGIMVKILEITLIIVGVLLGIIYGLMTVIRRQEKKSENKSSAVDEQKESIE